MFQFNSQHYRSGRFAFNSNGDMIIEYSYNNYRLFFGLKKSGKYFFSDEEGNEILTKEIEIENNGNEAQRYESQNIFISINADKQYLFSISTNISITELYDLETGQYLFKPTDDFLGNTIYSYIFSLFELPSEDYPKKYLLIYIYDKKYILQTISFSGFSLDVIKESNDNSTIVSFDNRIVSSFILDSLIIVFYVDSDSEDKYYYRIRLYNFNLDFIGNEDIDQIDGFNKGIGLFSKC